MDIKWKSNPKKRRLVIVVLFSLIVGTMAFYPSIIRKGERIYENYKDQRAQGLNSDDKEVLSQIYTGCYVLYKESKEWEGQSDAKTSDLFFDFNASKISSDIKDEIDFYIEELINQWSSVFEMYREQVDYCVLGENGASNTSRPLEQAVSDDSLNSELTSYYKEIFQVQFNENGVMEVTVFLAKDSNEEDVIIKELGKIDRKDLIKSTVLNNWGESVKMLQTKKPQNFTVIFAFPKRNEMTDAIENADYTSIYWYKIDAYTEAGAKVLYYTVMILLVLFAFYMGSRKVWGNEVMIDRPGNCYLMEAAIIGIILVLAAMSHSLIKIIWQYNYYESFSNLWGAIWSRGIYEAILPIIQTAIILLFVYTLWYSSISFVRPVFYLGVKEYIRQYSFFYQIFPWTKGKWNKFLRELHHIDFADKTTGVIFKVVLINFIILSLISSLWFFGIAALFIYSVILFYIIRRYYDKIRQDYRILLQGVSRIAEGDLNTVITEDLGIFEPFRNELIKIRTGFKKAVDNEVKSQRMKTELITNISHDLKTPLTAITTYIELLKKENITEEDRKLFIETLEKKSQRLKVLIEDLFEISKLSSNNIILNLMELDVVNLMKQVAVEYAERFQESAIEFRWKVPDEKIILKLDNQKTYRIFENLFVNVYKYAMHYSRAYIDVTKIGSKIMIVIKNVSAVELNISAEEITERFVRGDDSRTTEGSGLGLAIAKSLTEAQGGTFDVEIDGDLFKVLIGFPFIPKQV